MPQKIGRSNWEDSMIRTLITAAAAFSIFLAGSAINGSASAGGGAVHRDQITTASGGVG